MLGERLRQERPLDDRIVGVARAVRRVGVRQVGDHQQFLAEPLADLVVLVGEQLLRTADRPALLLERLGLGGLAPPAELADLLRQAR